MQVDFKTLINAAPFPEESRKKIFAKLDKLTDSQKARLIRTAWTALAGQYVTKTKYELDKLRLEIQKGERTFKKEDFDEAKKKVATEFAKKLKSAQGEQSIDKVRKELKKHMKDTNVNQPSSAQGSGTAQPVKSVGAAQTTGAAQPAQPSSSDAGGVKSTQTPAGEKTVPVEKPSVSIAGQPAKPATPSATKPSTPGAPRPMTTKPTAPKPVPSKQSAPTTTGAKPSAPAPSRPKPTMPSSGVQKQTTTQGAPKTQTPPATSGVQTSTAKPSVAAPSKPKPNPTASKSQQDKSDKSAEPKKPAGPAMPPKPKPLTVKPSTSAGSDKATPKPAPKAQATPQPIRTKPSGQTQTPSKPTAQQSQAVGQEAGEIKWVDDPSKSISAVDFEKQHKDYIESAEAFVNQEIKNRLSVLDNAFTKQFYAKGKPEIYGEIIKRVRDEGKYKKAEYKDDLLAKVLFASMQEKDVQAGEFLMALEYLMKKEKGEKDFSIAYKQLIQK